MDPRIAPPCTDDDITTGPCGPAAKCLQCKKTARILLDQAAVGRWDTVMNALRAWPKLVNYEPEFEEGHKTLVSVATPLYEGGPPKAPPPFAPCSARARHPAHRSAPAAPAPHPLRTRSVHAPCTLRARSAGQIQRAQRPEHPAAGAAGGAARGPHAGCDRAATQGPGRQGAGALLGAAVRLRATPLGGASRTVERWPPCMRGSRQPLLRL